MKSAPGILVFFVLAMLSCAPFYAQVKPVTPGIPNELDKKYSPGKSGILCSNCSKEDENAVNSSGSSDEVKHVIKTNLALWPRSIAAFGYQHFLTDDVAVEGWLGFPYNKDAVFTAMGSHINFQNNESYISLAEMFKYGKRDGVSLYLGGSVKFYFDLLGTLNENNAFFELTARTYANKLDLSALHRPDEGKSIIGGTDVKVRQNNYLVNLGIRLMSAGKIKTTHELYVGCGARNVSFDVFKDEMVLDPFLGVYVLQVKKNGQRETYSMPLIVMGYVLGIGF